MKKTEASVLLAFQSFFNHPKRLNRFILASDGDDRVDRVDDRHLCYSAGDGYNAVHRFFGSGGQLDISDIAQRSLAHVRERDDVGTVAFGHGCGVDDIFGTARMTDSEDQVACSQVGGPNHLHVRVGISVGVYPQAHEFVHRVDGDRIGIAKAEDRDVLGSANQCNRLGDCFNADGVVGEFQSMDGALEHFFHDDTVAVRFGDLLVDTLQRGDDVLGECDLQVLVPGHPDFPTGPYDSGVADTAFFRQAGNGQIHHLFGMFDDVSDHSVFRFAQARTEGFHLHDQGRYPVIFGHGQAPFRESVFMILQDGKKLNEWRNIFS